MEPQRAIKPKRQRKKKRRTEVSSDSESEVEKKEVTDPSTEQQASSSAQSTADTNISAAFTKFYMQQSTKEFEEDLDRIRGADDFKDDALPMLINALQQGTSLFSVEEQMRVVTGKET